MERSSANKPQPTFNKLPSLFVEMCCPHFAMPYKVVYFWPPIRLAKEDALTSAEKPKLTSTWAD